MLRACNTVAGIVLKQLLQVFMDAVLEENARAHQSGASAQFSRHSPKVCIIGIMGNNFPRVHCLPPYESLGGGGAPVDPSAFLSRWKGAIPTTKSARKLQLQRAH